MEELKIKGTLISISTDCIGSQAEQGEILKRIGAKRVKDKEGMGEEK